MNLIKKFFLMLYYRIKGTAPKFFQVLQWIGFLIAGYGVLLLWIMPDFDFGVFVINEGRPHQKIFFLGELMTALGIGLAIPPAFVVENFQKYLYRLREKGVDVTKDKGV